jgi:hypothetical protein
MKKTLLFTLFFVFILSLRGQNTVTYKFIDENKLVYKEEKEWFGSPFYSKRIYIQDSLFRESLLYDGKPYKFKVQNGFWYIKKTGKWQVFYSPYTSVTPKIKIYFEYGESWWMNFKAVRTDTLFGYHCIIYEMEPIPKVICRMGKIIKTIETELAHSPKYWFCPIFGIIKIETGGETNYIREDIIAAGADLRPVPNN